MAILALLGLVAERALRPLADQFAGLEVVGGEQRVGGVDRIERRVERDDDDAGVARLLHRRHDRGRVARHQQDALGAGGDQLLDRLDLAVVVAVELAGVGLRGEAELLGLGLEALLHLDEERIGVGLGDEADDVARRTRARGDSDGERRDGGARQKCRLFSDMQFLPEQRARRRFPRLTPAALRRRSGFCCQPASRRRALLGANSDAQSQG